MKCDKCKKETKKSWGVHKLGQFKCYKCYMETKTRMKNR